MEDKDQQISSLRSKIQDLEWQIEEFKRGKNLETVKNKLCRFLHKKEWLVLDTLYKANGEIIPTAALQKAISPDASTKVIEVYISRIRKKSIAMETPIQIQTHYGVGYSLSKEVIQLLTEEIENKNDL